MSGAKAEGDADDSLPLKLLTDIRNVWPEGQKEWDTASLIAALKALEESPWEEFGLSPHKVARMLRPFDISPRSVRIGKSTPKGYVSVQLEAAFTRYLRDESATPTQPA